MNKKCLALLAVGFLALPACSAGPQGAAVETSSSSAAPQMSIAPPEGALPSPSRNTNERGELIKEIGEIAGMPGQDGELDLEFTVTGFEFVKCSKYAPKLNGHALAAHVEVNTSSDFEGPVSINGSDGQIAFDAHYWRGYEPDGTRMNDISGDAILNCFESKAKLLPSGIRKGEKAKGLVLLDVTTKSGEVVFDPYGDGGWVWKFPGSKAIA